MTYQTFNVVPLTPAVESKPMYIKNLYKQYRDLIPKGFVAVCMANENGKHVYQICANCAVEVASMKLRCKFICTVRTIAELENLAENGLQFHVEVYKGNGFIDLWKVIERL